MLEVISDSKYSNVEVTNKTKINDFNFNSSENIVYLNNLLFNNENGEIILDKSNTTYVFQNKDETIYQKNITELKKNDKKDKFICKNNNLKKNDIITLHNVYNKDGVNLIRFPESTEYKVIQSDRESFIISTIDGLIDICKTSDKNIYSGYFDLRKSKMINRIVKVETPNIFTSPNHKLELNDMVSLENIKNNSNSDLLKYLYNSYSVYKIIDSNKFELIHIDNIDLVLESSNVTNGNAKKIKSGNPNTINTLNIILPNIEGDDYGCNFNLLINENIENITISTLNNNSLNGVLKLTDSNILGQEHIEIGDNKTKIEIKNTSLLHSRFDFTHIKLNEWNVDGLIFKNNVKYTVKFINGEYYFNDSIINTLNFYIDNIYEFDISDSSLLNNLFVIKDVKRDDFYKNTIYNGIIGKSGAKVCIHIDNTFVVNSEYYLEYKTDINNISRNYKKLFKINNTPILFT